MASKIGNLFLKAVERKKGAVPSAHESQAALLKDRLKRGRASWELVAKFTSRIPSLTHFIKATTKWRGSSELSEIVVAPNYWIYADRTSKSAEFVV